MKAVGVMLVIAVSLAADPGPADADGRHRHFRGEVHGSRRLEGHHHRHHHRGFVHRPAFPVFFGPSLVVAPPVVVAPPMVYAPPPVYAAPPGAYAVPAPPPVPRVLEFANGRYELRGDGVYSPYAWVWIPNPPATPPPPAAPPAPAAADPEPARRPAARTAKLYRWADEQGVTTWTDSLEKVPARYRAQASQLTP